jgi:hypothetical protein
MNDQIAFVMRERAEGHGASEALSGLMDMIEPIKDRSWWDDVRATPSDYDADQVVHYTLEAIFRLLHRCGLWNMKTTFIAGREFVGAVG